MAKPMPMLRQVLVGLYTNDIILTAGRCDVIHMSQLWHAFTVSILLIILSNVLQPVIFTQLFDLPFKNQNQIFLQTANSSIQNTLRWFSSSAHKYFCQTLPENCPYSELFWSSILSPYVVRMWGNADQNNSKYGHFLCSAKALDGWGLILFSLHKIFVSDWQYQILL